MICEEFPALLQRLCDHRADPVQSVSRNAPLDGFSTMLVPIRSILRLNRTEEIKSVPWLWGGGLKLERMKHMRIGRTGKRQSGATAIEFAFVFPLCFMLFYGSLMYGLIFLMRMGLQHSAEDGVRAALRYSNVNYPSGNTAAENRQIQMQARIAWATSVAATQASWMNGWHVPDIKANICPADTECLTSAAVAAYPDCSETIRCQVVMTVSYSYAAYPVIPTMPGFGLFAPNTLEGRARVLFDGRALANL